jgi:hypothetical protein
MRDVICSTYVWGAAYADTSTRESPFKHSGVTCLVVTVTLVNCSRDISTDTSQNCSPYYLLRGKVPAPSLQGASYRHAASPKVVFKTLLMLSPEAAMAEQIGWRGSVYHNAPVIQRRTGCTHNANRIIVELGQPEEAERLLWSNRPTYNASDC